jgi:hypothetical protein
VRAGKRRRRGGDWLVGAGSGTDQTVWGAHPSRPRVGAETNRPGRRRGRGAEPWLAPGGQERGLTLFPVPLPPVRPRVSSFPPPRRRMCRVPVDASSTGKRAKTCGEKGCRDEAARRHERLGTRQRTRADPRGGYSRTRPSLAAGHAQNDETSGWAVAHGHGTGARTRRPGRPLPLGRSSQVSSPHTLRRPADPSARLFASGQLRGRNSRDRALFVDHFKLVYLFLGESEDSRT